MGTEFAQCTPLDLLSAEGVPPEQFEQQVIDWAGEIITIAVEEFAVRMGRDAPNSVTPVMIGQTSALIESNQASQVHTGPAIVQYLAQALADYPQQYRRRNLSVYELTHRKTNDVLPSDIAAFAASPSVPPPSSVSGSGARDAANVEKPAPRITVGKLMQMLAKGDDFFRLSPVQFAEAQAEIDKISSEAYTRLLDLAGQIEGSPPEERQGLLHAFFAALGVKDLSNFFSVDEVKASSHEKAKGDKRCESILRNYDGNLKRVVTVSDACRYGGVGKRAIQKACKKGSLHSEGVGPNRRILVVSLLQTYPPEK